MDGLSSTNDSEQLAPVEDDLDRIQSELDERKSTRRERITRKFVLAALGAIPWVGGFLAAGAGMRAEEAATISDELRTQWLEEHRRRIQNLQSDMTQIAERLNELGENIEQRIQSEEYLELVRHAFQAWDRAATVDKRRYVSNLLTNAAGTRVCSDDIVRLFIGWIDQYHESHFAVIRDIHQHKGSTRADIWRRVYGEQPREDSAEADLYKMLIRDLSTAGVIRQQRETTEEGEYLKQRSSRRGRSRSAVLKSAFDDEKVYILTRLGEQFVHYTMNELVTRLDAQTEGA